MNNLIKLLDKNLEYIEHEIIEDTGLMSIFWTQKVKLFYATLLANNSH